MFKLNNQVDVIAARLRHEDRIAFYEGVQSNPLRFFCPNGAEEEYINTVANSLNYSPIPVILVRFANGVGNTTTSIMILLNLIYGPQNGWFDYPLFHNFPFPKKVWYCSSAEALSETIEPMINSIVRPDLWVEREYEQSKEGRRIISKMKFPKTSWDVVFKTFNQASKTYESANVGLVIVDEPGPEENWKAIKSRRRMGCITLLPMTPLYCEPYILDEINVAVESGLPGYSNLKADVYEACTRRGKRGHLNPDIIDAMVDAYDEDEKQARVFGDFMYYSNKIYELLDRNIHFVSPDAYPIPVNAKYLHIVDPHDSRPSASIHVARCENGRYIVFDETPADQKQPYWKMKRAQSIDDEVRSWIELEKKHKIDSVRIERILDRHFGWQTRGQKTLARIYLEAGIKLGKNFNFGSSYVGVGGESEITYGHKRVRQALKPLPDGGPGIVIYSNCYHTWNGLSHYIRRRLTGKTAEEKVPADAKIVEKYKDFPDVIRYMVCSDVSAPVAQPRYKTHAEKLRELAMRPVEQEKNEYSS